jgi:type II secretory pathway pseudopilin PulG
MTPVARRDEAGVTLVELLVVMMLMSIVGAMVLAALVDSTQVASRTTNSSVAENNGRLALRTISEDLRAAEQIRSSASTTACPTGVPFPAGFANCVAFLVPHETTSTAPTRTLPPGTSPMTCPFSLITYGLRAGVIREDRVDYNSSCTATTVLTGKAVLTGIDNSASQPLFRFYDTFGNQLGSTNTVADFTNAGSITIQVQLKYQNGAPDISLMTNAAFRNNR